MKLIIKFKGFNFINKEIVKFLSHNLSNFIWKNKMNLMKNQKSQNFLNLVKKEKLQNSGLNQTKSSKRFFFRKESEGFVVYDSSSSEVFFTNKTAKEILILIDKGLSKEDIIKKISNRYNISKKNALSEVNNILEKIK